MNFKDKQRLDSRVVPMGRRYQRDSKEHKDNLARTIGSRLKGLRKAMGLSLKQLAEATNLSPPLFSRVETQTMEEMNVIGAKYTDFRIIDSRY